jgi:surfactin synthase thioesterase subunit
VNKLINTFPRPSARLRVYCFPHSGGSAAEYAQFGESLDDFDFWAYQLPGRGSRRSETSAHDFQDILDDCSTLVFEPPYALFGHSFGALITYELVRRKVAPAVSADPDLLVVSACPAPSRLTDWPDLSGQSDLGLLDLLRTKYDSVPAEIADDPELLGLVLEPYRSDIRVLRSYAPPPPGQSRIDAPIAAIHAADDEIPLPDIEAWTTYSTHGARITTVDGGHFYFRESPCALVNLIDRLCDRRGPRRVR